MRRGARIAFWLVMGMASLVTIDALTPSGRVWVDGRWDSLVLTEFGPYQAAPLVPQDPSGFRVGDASSVVRLQGLPPGGSVRLRVVLASAVHTGLAVRIAANGATVAEGQVGGRPRRFAGIAHTDRQGRLSLRIAAAALRDAPGHCRLFQVSAVGGRRLPPWSRVALYALFVSGLVLALSATRDVRLAALAGILALLLLGVAIAGAKPVAVACMPALAVASLAFAAVTLLLGRIVALGRGEAAICACALVVRLLLALHPAFPAIDAVLHSHRLDTFKRGELVLNVASISDASPTPVWLPYPPMPYAVMSLLSTRQEDVALVRGVTAAAETLAPFLVLLIARAAGASRRSAALAFAAATVMPEGLLVIGKGVAANAIAMLAVLAALFATIRGLSFLAIAGLWTLAFLGHLGPAAGIGLLGVAWIVVQWRSGQGSSPRPRLLLSAMAVALAAAVLLYYAEAWSAAWRGLSRLRRDYSAGGNVLAVDWIGVGKLLQNLVVKYGLLLPPAAAIALQHRAMPHTLCNLLAAWTASGAALAVVGLTTTFVFRFEYFVAGAVALAAGQGLARWEQVGRRGLTGLTLAGSLAIQVVLGLAWLQGWWDPINVIIPSHRWWVTG